MEGRSTGSRPSSPATPPRAWSPGGRLLAFSNGDGVSISTPDGDEVHQLLFVPDGVAMTELRWSPRGDAIAFASSRELGALRPCVATSDGGVRRLVDCGGDFLSGRLRWSPDGAALLAPTSSCNGNKREMRVLDVAGLSEDVVVPYLSHPDWVPPK